MITETDVKAGSGTRVRETAAGRAAMHAYECRGNGQGRSIGGLFRDLVDQTRLLLRQELHLARAEITEKAAQAGRQSAMIVTGAIVALGGFIALIAAACTGLWVALIAADVEHQTAVWLAPLIVGIVVAVIGYALIHAGVSALRRMSVVPEKAAESLKETGRWMHEKVT